MPKLAPILTNAPSMAELAARWDLNASERNAELSSNNDPAYRALSNLICNYVAGQDIREHQLCILDAGCGVGFLAATLSDLNYDVVGIDPSGESIRLAKTHSHDAETGPEFFAQTIEDYAANAQRQFDVIVANMTLHCVPKLASFMATVSSLLKPDGYLLATIPNPDTYLQGRNDIDLDNIDLRRDQVLEVPFRIHASLPHAARVFFFHRPFRTYLASAEASKLRISNFYVPEQIGTGRPRDIALIEFRRRLNG